MMTILVCFRFSQCCNLQIENNIYVKMDNRSLVYWKIFSFIAV